MTGLRQKQDGQAVIIPDVNLLVYAYDTTVRLTVRARVVGGSFVWERARRHSVGRGASLCCAFDASGSLRSSMTIEECRSAVGVWLAQRHVSLLEPTSATLGFFFAHLAAWERGQSDDRRVDCGPCTERGGRVYSNDRDFARFRAFSGKIL
jgi:hypothetical protein